MKCLEQEPQQIQPLDDSSKPHHENTIETLEKKLEEFKREHPDDLEKMVYSRSFIQLLQEIVKISKVEPCPLSEEVLKEFGIDRATMPANATRRSYKNTYTGARGGNFNLSWHPKNQMNNARKRENSFMRPESDAKFDRRTLLKMIEKKLEEFKREHADELEKRVYSRSFIQFLREVIKLLKVEPCPLSEEVLKKIGIDRATMPPPANVIRRGNPSSHASGCVKYYERQEHLPECQRNPWRRGDVPLATTSLYVQGHRSPRVVYRGHLQDQENKLPGGAPSIYAARVEQLQSPETQRRRTWGSHCPNQDDSLSPSVAAFFARYRQGLRGNPTASPQQPLYDDQNQHATFRGNPATSPLQSRIGGQNHRGGLRGSQIKRQQD